MSKHRTLSAESVQDDDLNKHITLLVILEELFDIFLFVTFVTLAPWVVTISGHYLSYFIITMVGNNRLINLIFLVKQIPSQTLLVS